MSQFVKLGKHIDDLCRYNNMNYKVEFTNERITIHLKCSNKGILQGGCCFSFKEVEMAVDPKYLIATRIEKAISVIFNENSVIGVWSYSSGLY